MKSKGAQEHVNRLRRMRSRTAQQVVAALYAGGQEIELEAEHSITQGSISGKGHVPSAPGEPPNADTRRLDSSIETTVVAQNPPEVHVTVNDPKGVYLEYGTSKMAERPFMRPAVARKRDDVVRLVGEAVSVVIRG